MRATPVLWLVANVLIYENQVRGKRRVLEKATRPLRGRISIPVVNYLTGLMKIFDQKERGGRRDDVGRRAAVRRGMRSRYCDGGGRRNRRRRVRPIVIRVARPDDATS